jgi:hypothetical protein
MEKSLGEIKPRRSAKYIKDGFAIIKGQQERTGQYG